MLKNGLLEPIFITDGMFSVTFFRKDTNKDTNSLSQNEKEILMIIRNNPRISISHLSLRVGINIRNIKNNLEKLKNKGLIERIGKPKGGFWKIIQ
jgi:ATP-dependent DNA helicase RecG